MNLTLNPQRIPKGGGRASLEDANRNIYYGEAFGRQTAEGDYGRPPRDTQTRLADRGADQVKCPNICLPRHKAPRCNPENIKLLLPPAGLPRYADRDDLERT